MKRPGLFELQAVAAVATHQSFRAAAQELEISPSALSHAVAALEQRMGVRLFHRTTRSVALSEAGERFLARVRPALQELSTAMDSINEFRDSPRGTLRLNTFEPAARELLAPVVLEFLKRHPDMRLELVTDARFVDIVKEGFDAGIRFREAVPADMIAVPCGPPQRAVVVGTPAYLKKWGTPRTPHDLKGHRCIRTRKPRGGFYAWEFERRGQTLEVDVDGPLSLDTWSLIVDAALHGAGLAYLSGTLDVSAHLEKGRLVSVLDDWLPEFPGLCVYYPGHRHVPAGLRAFLDVAKHAYLDLSASPRQTTRNEQNSGRRR
jgi:DNA-binding transcriptional LysR family regulator